MGLMLLSVLFAVMAYATYANDIHLLLDKMTLGEKIGQMVQIDISYFMIPNTAKVNYTLMESYIRQYPIGSMLNSPFSGGPVEGKTGWTASEWRELMKDIAQIVKDNTKLNIPVIYGIDSIHGATFVKGAALFPQAINIGATFNPSIALSVGEITSKDTRAAGIPWIFAPVLGLGLQPLWARFAETFGEDPYLAAQLGASVITGLQNSEKYFGNTTPKKTAACMKHFIAYSIPQDGHDRSPVQLPDRLLRELYLPSFQAAIDANVLTAMESYQEVGGVPMVSSKDYLTNLIRKEMNFTGFLVTDYAEIENLHNWHMVSSTQKEAVLLAMQDTTIDMSMVPLDSTFYEYLYQLVQEGNVNISRIDESVLRILEVKKELGLFDMELDPAEDNSLTQSVGEQADWDVSLLGAEESITLVKNNVVNGQAVLPFSKGTTTKVLLTGPTANSSASQTGGWSIHWQGIYYEYEENKKVTVLRGLQTALTEANVVYTPGPALDATSTTGIDFTAITALAQDVDVIVVCVGEGTYAEKPGDINDLALPQGQIDYISELATLTGKPIVTIMIAGRPRLFHTAVSVSSAVLLAYQPGPLGGQAITEILLGTVIPSGRLPFTYPQDEGNVMIPYHHKYSDQCVVSTGFHSTSYIQCIPEWTFGTGLSYTSFVYSNLQLSATTINENQDITISVDVENTGNYDAKHTVMMFVYDLYRRVTPEYKLLKRFTKITIPKGTKQTVTWTISASELQYVGVDSRYVLENGDYSIGISETVDCRSDDTNSYLIQTPDSTSTVSMCQSFSLVLSDNYYPVCDNTCAMWTEKGGICGQSMAMSTCRQTCIAQDWTWDYNKCLLNYYQSDCTNINEMQCYDSFAMQATHAIESDDTRDNVPLSTLLLCSVGSGLLGLLLGAILAYLLSPYILKDRERRTSRNSLVQHTFFKSDDAPGEGEQFISGIHNQT